ncbi:hypothetical protein FA15DRAFT_617357 [Coprinopsis marcescibilis]|uniref:Velvet domain-containing protein n=1 Tax=Coprinopsis marcescibilis TaxID=230819 RepID=A0A5C3KZ66_COPMA|nr:hypothetical protein FA15DRAFT_617357 [Coprinopsis marcescibilis]
MIQQRRDVHSQNTLSNGKSRSSNTKDRFCHSRSETPLRCIYQNDERSNRRCYPSPPSSSASSGQSSPQSTFNPGPFSSRASTASSSSISQSSTSSVDSPSSSSYQNSVNRQTLPGIQVSSLLADPHLRSYRLEVVQQPQCAAEFGLANLSRLPITPPVVVKLVIKDPSGNTVVPEGEIPFLVAHLSLHSEDGTQSLDMGSQIGAKNQAPILYGNLVSSVECLEDLQGNTGLFLLFPDVSVRWKGRYQLGITLSKLSSATEPSGCVNVAENATHLCHTRTMPFEVLHRSDYSAAPQTRLTQSFIRQGARMSFFS